MTEISNWQLTVLTVLACIGVVGVAVLLWFVFNELIENAAQRRTRTLERKTRDLEVELATVKNEASDLAERLEDRERTIAALRGTPFRTPGGPS